MSISAQNINGHYLCMHQWDKTVFWIGMESNLTLSPMWAESSERKLGATRKWIEDIKSMKHVRIDVTYVGNPISKTVRLIIFPDYLSSPIFSPFLFSLLPLSNSYTSKQEKCTDTAEGKTIRANDGGKQRSWHWHVHPHLTALGRCILAQNLGANVCPVNYHALLSRQADASVTVTQCVKRLSKRANGWQCVTPFWRQMTSSRTALLLTRTLQYIHDQIHSTAFYARALQHSFIFLRAFKVLMKIRTVHGIHCGEACSTKMLELLEFRHNFLFKLNAPH